MLLPGDLSDESFARSLVHKAREALGGLDILALVAGKQTAIPEIKDLTSEQFQQTFAVNVFALFWITQKRFRCCQKAPVLSQRRLSSVSAQSAPAGLCGNQGGNPQLQPWPGETGGGKGIRVNIVAPGPIWTALQISGGQTRDKIPQFGQQTPMKRAGQPAELAPVYVYLASRNPVTLPQKCTACAAGSI